MEYLGQQHFFDPLKPFPNERVIWEEGAAQKAFVVHKEERDMIKRLLTILHPFLVRTVVVSMAVIVLSANGYATPHKELLHAVLYGDIETVRTALEHGIDPNTPLGANTPLMFAAQSIHEQAEICKLLIEKGADVNLKNSMNQTALILAAQNGHARVVKLLLEHGADVQVEDQWGSTAMKVAIDNTHVDILLLLLAHGARICTPDEHISVNVIQAIVGGNTESVKHMLVSGMDVNATCDRYSLLEYAVLGGSPDIVKLLLEHGADVQTEKLNRLLLDVTNAEVATLLIDQGADLHAHSDSGDTVLMYAALRGYADVVELFIQHGVAVNALATGITQDTALIKAAIKGHVEVANVLLKHEADVNAQDSEGWTALMYAALNGHPEVVKRLLEHGADVTIQNNNGKTALYFAESNEQIIRLLKEAGAQ